MCGVRAREAVPALVSPSAAGAFHRVSRCGCGADPPTQYNFDHRRQWIEDRLALWAGSFAISVYSFAVMSHHLHAVFSVESDRCKNGSKKNFSSAGRE